jgi:hypothetical protein
VAVLRTGIELLKEKPRVFSSFTSCLEICTITTNSHSVTKARWGVLCLCVMWGSHRLWTFTHRPHHCSSVRQYLPLSWSCCGFSITYANWGEQILKTQGNQRVTNSNTEIFLPGMFTATLS